MEIKYNSRGFAYITFRDKYNSLIRIQQSSADLTDCWIFIDESPLLDTDAHPILDYNMIREIEKFSKWLQKNF